MIGYFVHNLEGTIVGIGTAIDTSLITPPEGQTLVVGIVPEGANTYINGVFSTAPKPISQVEQEALVKRYQLLCASDWTQLHDVPLTEVQKQQWAIYRQELRDLTYQQYWPTNIIWPTKPE
jgi:Phage tail assembly chaperone protein